MATHESTTAVTQLHYAGSPHVIPISQPLPTAEISKTELIDDELEERDNTDWQDFLAYHEGVRP